MTQPADTTAPKPVAGAAAVGRRVGAPARGRRGRVVVPSRFNGPRTSGNGGYSAGAFAGLLSGPAAVGLRSPVPLGTELTVYGDEEQVSIVADGGTLIASVSSSSALDLTVPERITVEQAREAAKGYRGAAEGPFGACFVCGRGRDDALGVFAGPVPDTDVVASSWIPPAWGADPMGWVREELIWAVLDCPTYYACYARHPGRPPAAMLARMEARLDLPLEPGREVVVLAWPIARNGRKLHAGSAVLDEGGRLIALSRVLLIEVRSTPGSERLG